MIASCLVTAASIGVGIWWYAEQPKETPTPDDMIIWTGNLTDMIDVFLNYVDPDI